MSVVLKDNSWAELEKEFFARIDGISEGQYNFIARDVIKRVISKIKTTNLASDSSETRSKLYSSLSLLDELHSAVNLFDNRSRETKNKRLYFDYNWESFPFLYPWIKDKTREVDIHELAKVINQYISFDWLESPHVEWILVNAYLKYCIQVNREAYIYRIPFSARSLAFLVIQLGRNIENPLGYFGLYMAFKVIRIMVLWVLPIVAIYYLGVNEYVKTAFAVVGVRVVTFLYSLISSFQRRFLARRLKKVLFALYELKSYTRCFSWSIPFIKDRVSKQCEQLPELLPLIAKIARRDSELFNLACQQNLFKENNYTSSKEYDYVSQFGEGS